MNAHCRMPNRQHRDAFGLELNECRVVDMRHHLMLLFENRNWIGAIDTRHHTETPMKILILLNQLICMQMQSGRRKGFGYGDNNKKLFILINHFIDYTQTADNECEKCGSNAMRSFILSALFINCKQGRDKHIQAHLISSTNALRWI